MPFDIDFSLREICGRTTWRFLAKDLSFLKEWAARLLSSPICHFNFIPFPSRFSHHEEKEKLKERARERRISWRKVHANKVRWKGRPCYSRRTTRERERERERGRRGIWGERMIWGTLNRSEDGSFRFIGDAKTTRQIFYIYYLRTCQLLGFINLTIWLCFFQFIPNEHGIPRQDWNYHNYILKF